MSITKRTVIHPNLAEDEVHLLHTTSNKAHIELGIVYVYEPRRDEVYPVDQRQLRNRPPVPSKVGLWG